MPKSDIVKKTHLAKAKQKQTKKKCLISIIKMWTDAIASKEFIW